MLAAMKPKEIPSLDGIRAIAVMIVVVAHAAGTQLIPGGFGVSIFFFLSGFLITQLFFDEQRRAGAIDLGAFYLRRLLRLTPPLFVTLAVAYWLVLVGVAPGEFHWRTIAAQALYYFNYYAIYWQGDTAPGAEGLGVLWSLAVEEHFYLLYPALFIALMAMKSNARRLWALGAVLAGCLGWRLFLKLVAGASSDHLYMASDSRFDSILYGCFLAFLMKEGLAARVFPAGARAMTAISLAAGGVLLVTLLWRDTLFRDTLRYSLQGAAFVPLFYYAVRFPKAAHHQVLNAPLLVMVGTYSYSIYLIHKVIIATIEKWVPSLAGSLASVLLAVSLSVIYAAAVHRYVEGPVAQGRRRILEGRDAAPSRATGPQPAASS